jgi:hypothetical protein
MRSFIVRSITLAALLAPTPALAIGGLYVQFGLGYGKYGGSGLILQEQPAGNDLPLEAGDDGCCGKGGLASQLRVGYSLFGFAGELGVIGSAYDLGGDTGGGGMIGGGIRLYPLDIMKLVGAELDLPIDIGMGLLFGYTLVGKDFAYTGFAMDVDFHVDFKLTSFLSVGAKIDVGLPTFSDFAFTDYKNDVGRCLDDSGEQIVGDASNNYGRVSKEEANCSGKGPSSTYISPSIVLTMHFDVFE